MLIKGNTYIDQRGIIGYVNDFHFEGIKRFYTITHRDITVVRAWQGHKIEDKFFFVTKGEFLMCWVKIDDWANPSKILTVHKQVLSSENPQILTILHGNVNGFKALKADSQLMVFSNLLLEESLKDDYRFEKDYWEFD